MTPPRPDQHGERLSALEATVTALDKYEHDRWHKLANDLTPLMQLPERMAREIGKLQGTFDGRISVVTKEIERSITAAVEKAIEPLSDGLSRLETRVEALETTKDRDEGAKSVIAAIFKSPLLAWVVAAAGVVWAFISGKTP